jgi:hypothetical protein
MKTKVKREIDYHNGSKNEEHLVLDTPYTVFGYTKPPDSWNVIMKVGGLRKILDEFELDGEDSLRITTSVLGTQFSFIKESNKKEHGNT